MKRNLLYLTFILCISTTGMIQAKPLGFFGIYEYPKSVLSKSLATKNGTRQQSRSSVVRPVYLPTVAYRTATNYYDNPFSKYIYSYDDYGHIISEKVYTGKNTGEYELEETIIREFHRLPNGEFVKIKEDDGSRRFTAKYDNKGMQLWRQIEHYNHDNSQWELFLRIEAITNENGIRTAIRYYDPYTETYEINNAYTFDDKGRVIRIESEFGDRETYTWNANNQIIETSFSSGEDILTLKNITSVLNGEYFDVYSLSPGEMSIERNSDDDSGDDYGLHLWYYNANYFLNNVLIGNIQTTINEAKDEIVLKLTLDEQVQQVLRTRILDAYGSYSIVNETEDGDDTIFHEYNEYGALVRDYSSEYDNIREGIYQREYDASDRPSKTTYFFNDEKVYEERYDAWFEKPTSIKKLPMPILSIYPNPAVDQITINGAKGANVIISDALGRVIYKKNQSNEIENIPATTWEKGIYFVVIQIENKQIAKKIAKQ